MQTTAQVVVLFISSFLTVALSFLKISVIAYQQIIIFLLVISMGVFSRVIAVRSAPQSRSIGFVNYFILLITSLIIQLLVISSGGFYSPFLVLFHFYFIGLSFLVNLRSAISFLGFALLAVGIDIAINPLKKELFFADIGTALLYIISFVVIIPLAHYIASKYQLKDELSKILTGQVKLGQSIMEGLSEMVVVTDLELKVVSVNESLKKLLQKSDGELLNKSIFDVLDLRNGEKLPASIQSLSVDRVMVEKTTRIVNDFLLYVPNRSMPFKVSIQIRPILGAGGELEKLALVITQGVVYKVGQGHPDLEAAQLSEQKRFEQLKLDLNKLKLSQLSNEVDLLRKTEEDLGIARQLEDYPIRSQISFVDMAALLKTVIKSKEELARNLNVSLVGVMPGAELVKESTIASLDKSDSNMVIPISDYAVPVDPKWSEVCLSRLIDLGLFLSNGQGSEVKVSLEKTANTFILLNVSFSLGENVPNLEQVIFNKYYSGIMHKSNLYLGSGLEGFIVKTITSELNIPIKVKQLINSPAVMVTLTLNRTAN